MLPTSRARLWNAKHPCHEYGVIDHEIVWAVVDSGIDARHPHVSALDLARKPPPSTDPAAAERRTQQPPATLHRDFSGPREAAAGAGAGW